MSVRSRQRTAIAMGTIMRPYDRASVHAIRRAEPIYLAETAAMEAAWEENKRVLEDGIIGNIRAERKREAEESKDEGGDDSAVEVAKPAPTKKSFPRVIDDKGKGELYGPPLPKADPRTAPPPPGPADFPWAQAEEAVAKAGFENGQLNSDAIRVLYLFLGFMRGTYVELQKDSDQARALLDTAIKGGTLNSNPILVIGNQRFFETAALPILQARVALHQGKVLTKEEADLVFIEKLFTQGKLPTWIGQLKTAQ
jgi:hypothetical protein